MLHLLQIMNPLSFMAPSTHQLKKTVNKIFFFDKSRYVETNTHALAESLCISIVPIFWAGVSVPTWPSFQNNVQKVAFQNKTRLSARTHTGAHAHPQTSLTGLCLLLLLLSRLLFFAFFFFLDLVVGTSSRSVGTSSSSSSPADDTPSLRKDDELWASLSVNVTAAGPGGVGGEWGGAGGGGVTVRALALRASARARPAARARTHAHTRRHARTHERERERKKK